MTGALDERIIAGAVNPVEGKVVEFPSHQAINEKKIITVGTGVSEKDALESEIHAAPHSNDADSHNKDHDSDQKDTDTDSENVIIITGADAAAHLLPLRDDGEPALTFRSLFLATGLSGFQSVMNQIYQVRTSPQRVDI